MITIFIHGTLFSFLKLPFLQTFFFCPLGIMPITDIPQKYHIRTLTETLCKADPIRFDNHNFYTFGWCGTLSDRARNKASEKLYKDIKSLITFHKARYKETPLIRLIAHSHGGNVALRLADQINKNTPFSIEELILLACPVQKNTAHLVTHPLFKKVYSLYSYTDFIQVIDPQGLSYFWNNFTIKNNDSCPLFSLRNFAHTSTVAQARIKINNKNLKHLDFLRPHFLKYLPIILNTLEQHKKIPPLPLHEERFILKISIKNRI